MSENNVNFGFQLNAQQMKAQLMQMNQNLMLVNTGIININNSSAKAVSAHNAHAGAVKGMALRFAGYNLVLNQVMGAQQRLIEFTQESVKSFREFETRLAEVSTILTGEALDSMIRLGLSVEHLSKQFGQDTSDMSKGLYDILSAAFSARDAINLLNTSTKASIAGLSEVRTSVQIFTSVLNAYGKTVEQATAISDSLFQSVVRGKFQYEELESALGYVVPIAAQAGIAFDELMAALSTATRQGLHLDMTSRGLALAIQNIIDPSQQAAKAAAKYGIEMDGLALRVLGLSGWFAELKQKTDEFGRGILTEVIPNMRSLRVAMVLASEEGVKGMADDLVYLEQAAGRTEEALAKIQETSQFASNVLAQEMEQVKRDVGNAWDELVLGIQGGVVGIAKNLDTIKIAFGDFGAIMRTITKPGIASQREDILAGFKLTDDDVSNAQTYLHLLEYIRELTATYEEMPEEGYAKGDLKETLEGLIELSGDFEQSWNRVIGGIQDSIDELDELGITFTEIEKDVAELQGKLTEPIAVGWGNYAKTIRGTLNYQLELLQAEQLQVDAQHDIKMGLMSAEYQYKSLNAEMQEAVRIVREHKKAQEEDREATNRLNIAMRELQLQAAKIQLAGMMRRRGLTRNEEKMLKKIQIEQLKLRIQNMEAENDETVQMYDNYLEKQQMIDDFLMHKEEEVYQLKYSYDQEIADLTNQIETEKQKLQTRYEWWDLINGQIIDSSTSMISTLKSLMEDSTFSEMLKEWGIDLENLRNQILAIQNTAETRVNPGKVVSVAPGNVDLFNKPIPATNVGAAQIQGALREKMPDLFQFNRGTFYIPETAPYMLHRGETVSASGRDSGGGDTIVNVNVTGNTITRETFTNIAAELQNAVNKGLVNARTGKSNYRLR